MHHSSPILTHSVAEKIGGEVDSDIWPVKMQSNEWLHSTLISANDSEAGNKKFIMCLPGLHYLPFSASLSEWGGGFIIFM